MRTRFKTLTIGMVLATAAMAGCSSTTGSSGAVQDDATASASAASTASTAPAPSPDPVTPTAEPTEVPASPGASPTVSPPLLGGSSNPYCNTGLEYSCGEVGPGGGIVFLAVSTPFSLSNGYTTAVCGTNNCQYMEAVPAWESPTAENPTGFQMPGPMAWCVGPGATTSVSPGTGAAIGTGYSNTQTMATKSGYCSSGAANTAIASTWGGYSDWFIPSQDEGTALTESSSIYQTISNGNTCWTSSQSSAKNAWTFSLGKPQNNIKANSTNVSGGPNMVCLVRAF
jgi:hypothetical protein